MSNITHFIKPDSALGVAMSRFGKGLLMGASALAFAVAFATPASAAICPAFDNPAGAGTMSHQSVIEYVSKRHGGDWSAYLSSWKKLARTMEIRGEDVAARYQRRLAVIDCLAIQEISMVRNPGDNPGVLDK